MLGHGHAPPGVAFFVGLVILAIVIAASRPERRRLLDTLEEAGAVSPDTAMTSYQLLGDHSTALDRLVRDGLVAVTADNRYYVVAPRTQVATPRFGRAITALGIAVGILIVGLGVVWTIRQ